LLEPVARKRARPVLRGPRRSNAPGLPDERWFKELTERRLRRGVFTSVADLTEAISTWAGHWNIDPKPFIWKTTAEDILAKVQPGRRHTPPDQIADGPLVLAQIPNTREVVGVILVVVGVALHQERSGSQETQRAAGRHLRQSVHHEHRGSPRSDRLR
jgi:hypothetical protein